MLLGFQITAFIARLGREITVGDDNRITWLPPSDMLSLASTVLTALGVYILPLLGWVTFTTAGRVFGLALLLFVGYPFALAGHYDMYNHKTRRSFEYCTFQEKVVIGVVLLIALAYCACLALV